MKKHKTYLILTLFISFLFGIILPLGLGVKDLTLIAICFSSVWFIYAVLLLITAFLIKPGLKINPSTIPGLILRLRSGQAPGVCPRPELGPKAQG
jgi:hypothetical protein